MKSNPFPIISTPKPSQSSTFSLEGFIISLRRAAAVSLQPGALKPRASKPGASKPARYFMFGTQERCQDLGS